MKNLILGILIGSALTGTVVCAGTFYDQAGKPSAPSGSVQQFDYFRQRQQFLDLGAMRRNSDAMRVDPCAR